MGFVLDFHHGDKYLGRPTLRKKDLFRLMSDHGYAVSRNIMEEGMEEASCSPYGSQEGERVVEREPEGETKYTLQSQTPGTYLLQLGPTS